VAWAIHPGYGHEAATEQDAAASGTWTGDGLQYTQRPRVRAGSMVLQLSNGETARPWAVETITAVYEQGGRNRRA
jgi:hypothetical protein